MATFCNNTNYIANICATTINGNVPSGRAILKVDERLDRYHAHIGDTVTYNLIISNIGDTLATNIKLFEEIKRGIAFVGSTLSINGVVYSALNPYTQDGAILGNIQPGGFLAVSFKVRITELPQPNEVFTMSTLKFNYTKDQSNKDGELGTIKSNEVSIKIKYINIKVLSTVNKQNARLGDVLTFSTEIINTGNIDATNIRFMNTIPNEAVLIKDSYSLNSNPMYGVDPTPKYGGIVIGTLPPNSRYVVIFNIKVERIPTECVLKNKSIIKYDYTVDPSMGSSMPQYLYANEVIVNIREAIINYGDNYGIIKTVDKTFADICDVLTYTVRLRNTGSTKANEVYLLDSIPDGGRFIENSVIVNGKIESGANPGIGSGIRIGSIEADSMVTIGYKVEIISLPKKNPVETVAMTKYKFSVNPYEPNKESAVGFSNSVKINIENGNLAVRMINDKEHADIGDVITYTLSITNVGNVTVDNLRVFNNIPESTTLCPESITLNCRHLMFGNVERGIVIPCLTPNKTSIINFKVKVTSILQSGNIKNSSMVKYQYYNEDKNLIEKEACSNNVYTSVHSVNFQGENFQQKVNAMYASEGDKITYTFNIKNAGNIRATEIMFYDTLPSELEYIKESLTINGDICHGGNPANGIVLGNLGNNDSFIIVFSAKIKETPLNGLLNNKGVLIYKYNMNPNIPLITKRKESNEIGINIKSPKIVLYKTVSPLGASIGKVVTYTVKVSNAGNANTEEVIIKDGLHSTLEFKEDSVTVDGRYNNGNIINGINIGKLRPGAYKEVSYKAEIIAFPDTRILQTVASSRYRFIVNPADARFTKLRYNNFKIICIPRYSLL